MVIAYLGGEDQDAKQTARLVEAAGRTAVLVPGDLTSEQAYQELVDRTVSEFGRIDLLVNNAAFQMAQAGGIEDISPPRRPGAARLCNRQGRHRQLHPRPGDDGRREGHPG